MTERLSLSGARERYRKIHHSSHPEIKHYFFNIFNWKIIAFEYCIGFLSYISMNQPWIYVPSFVKLPPSSHPLGCRRAPGLSSCRKFPLVICFTSCRVHVSVTLLQPVPPPSPLCPSVSSLCLRLYFLSVFNFFFNKTNLITCVIYMYI